MTNLDNEDFKQFLLHQSELAFGLSDKDGKIIGCNRALLNLVGMELSDINRIVLSRQLVPIAPSEDMGLPSFWGDRSNYEAILVGRDGSKSFVEVLVSPFRVDQTEDNFGFFLFDITKYKNKEDQLRRQALIDSLTGLPNRSYMSDRLAEAMASSERDAEVCFAILYIDVDDFKVINDTLGHDFGDAVLSEVGRRLHNGIRKYDKASRWGGDEFVVFLGASADKAGIKKRVRQLQQQLCAPFEFEGQTVSISTSVGLVFNDGTYTDHKEMLQDADRAMYRAKKSGGNCFVVHEVNSLAYEEWENPANDLRSGMERDELFLEYQPIVRITDRKVIGVEALVRWQHPERGLIPPMQIISIAESSGFCREISMKIVDQAVRDLDLWNQGLDESDRIHVHLNCPASLLSDNHFGDALALRLNSEEQLYSNIYLEVSKDALDEKKEKQADFTLPHNFRSMLAVDDLSLSMSSLNLFYHNDVVPFDLVKVDKSIVQNICRDRNTRDTLYSFVRIFDSIGVSLVAKNVETPEQFETLKSLNCSYAQGFYISPPINALSVKDMLWRSSCDEYDS